MERSAPCMAIAEKNSHRTTSGGCTDVFFKLFQWSRIFSKKILFPKKLLLRAGEEHVSKRYMNKERAPMESIHLITATSTNNGGFIHGKKKKEEDNHRHVETEHGSRSPGLVARLMGLESLPEFSEQIQKTNKDPCSSDSRLLKPSKKISQSHNSKLPSQLKEASARNHSSSSTSSRLINVATKILEPKNRVKHSLTHSDVSHMSRSRLKGNKTPEKYCDESSRSLRAKTGRTSRQRKRRGSDGEEEEDRRQHQTSRRDSNREASGSVSDTRKRIVLKGDALGAILDRTLKELNCEDEEETKGTRKAKRSTAVILQDLISALTTDEIITKNRSEPDTDVSDYGTVTDLRDRISCLLTKMNEAEGIGLKGSQLIHARDVIMNAELLSDSVAGSSLIDQFLVLGGNNKRPANWISGSDRGFFFNGVIECLDSRYSNFFGLKPQTKLSSHVSIESLFIEETRKWRKLAGKSADEIIEWDMMNCSYGKWKEFDEQVYETGVYASFEILEDLIEELVIDLCP